MPVDYASSIQHPPAGTSLWSLAEEHTGCEPVDSSEQEIQPRPRARKWIGLLVEDNLPDVMVVEDAISQHQVPVELYIVDDGEKACEFIDRAANDPEAPRLEFLLLDLNLPKRSGIEVLHHLRNRSQFRDIPVLIITSSDLSRDRDRFAELGANRYFRKPPDYEKFLKVGEVLKELLEQHKRK
jgi:CheY-like chemotaxis protein